MRSTNTPDIGVSLTVRVRLLDAEQGGVLLSLVSGYRPLCIVPDAEHGPVTIGLCQLTLDQPLLPGRCGTGRLAFDRAVEAQVRTLLPLGTRFSLAEGSHLIATAKVVHVQ